VLAAFAGAADNAGGPVWPTVQKDLGYAAPQTHTYSIPASQNNGKALSGSYMTPGGEQYMAVPNPNVPWAGLANEVFGLVRGQYTPPSPSSSPSPSVQILDMGGNPVEPSSNPYVAAGQQNSGIYTVKVNGQTVGETYGLANAQAVAKAAVQGGTVSGVGNFLFPSEGAAAAFLSQQGVIESTGLGGYGGSPNLVEVPGTQGNGLPAYAGGKQGTGASYLYGGKEFTSLKALSAAYPDIVLPEAMGGKVLLGGVEFSGLQVAQAYYQAKNGAQAPPYLPSAGSSAPFYVFGGKDYATIASLSAANPTLPFQGAGGSIWFGGRSFASQDALASFLGEGFGGEPLKATGGYGTYTGVPGWVLGARSVMDAENLDLEQAWLSSLKQSKANGQELLNTLRTYGPMSVGRYDRLLAQYGLPSLAYAVPGGGEGPGLPVPSNLVYSPRTGTLSGQAKGGAPGWLTHGILPVPLVAGLEKIAQAAIDDAAFGLGAVAYGLLIAPISFATTGRVQPFNAKAATSGGKIGLEAGVAIALPEVLPAILPVTATEVLLGGAAFAGGGDVFAVLAGQRITVQGTLQSYIAGEVFSGLFSGAGAAGKALAGTRGAWLAKLGFAGIFGGGSSAYQGGSPAQILESAALSAITAGVLPGVGGRLLSKSVETPLVSAGFNPLAETTGEMFTSPSLSSEGDIIASVSKLRAVSIPEGPQAFPSQISPEFTRQVSDILGGKSAADAASRIIAAESLLGEEGAVKLPLGKLAGYASETALVPRFDLPSLEDFVPWLSRAKAVFTGAVPVSTVADTSEVGYLSRVGRSIVPAGLETEEPYLGTPTKVTSPGNEGVGDLFAGPGGGELLQQTEGPTPVKPPVPTGGLPQAPKTLVDVSPFKVGPAGVGRPFFSGDFAIGPGAAEGEAPVNPLAATRAELDKQFADLNAANKDWLAGGGSNASTWARSRAWALEPPASAAVGAGPSSGLVNGLYSTQIGAYLGQAVANSLAKKRKALGGESSSVVYEEGPYNANVYPPGVSAVSAPVMSSGITRDPYVAEAVGPVSEAINSPPKVSAFPTSLLVQGLKERQSTAAAIRAALAFGSASRLGLSTPTMSALRLGSMSAQAMAQPQASATMQGLQLYQLTPGQLDPSLLAPTKLQTEEVQIGLGVSIPETIVPTPTETRRVTGLPTLPSFSSAFRGSKKRKNGYGYRILEHPVANSLVSNSLYNKSSKERESFKLRLSGGVRLPKIRVDVPKPGKLPKVNMSRGKRRGKRARARARAPWDW